MNSKISVLEEAHRRIHDDRGTFADCGRSVKGHNRSLMIIRELISEIPDETDSGKCSECGALTWPDPTIHSDSDDFDYTP